APRDKGRLRLVQGQASRVARDLTLVDIVTINVEIERAGGLVASRVDELIGVERQRDPLLADPQGLRRVNPRPGGGLQGELHARGGTVENLRDERIARVLDGENVALTHGHRGAVVAVSVNAGRLAIDRHGGLGHWRAARVCESAEKARAGVAGSDRE